MCLGYVRYSIRVFHHPRYLRITFMCFPSLVIVQLVLTSQNPPIERSFPSVFIVHTILWFLVSLSFFYSFVFIPVDILPSDIPDTCLVPVSCFLFPVFRSIPVSLVVCCFDLFIILFASVTPPPLAFSLVCSLLFIHGYMFI